MLLIPLLACQPTIDGALPGDPATTSPEPWVYQASTEDSPTYDAAMVEAALQQTIDLALQLHAGPVMDAYLQVIDGADARCPEWYEQDGNVFWYDLCTSDQGTLFDGYGFFYEYDRVDLDGSGVLWSGESLYGVATITTPAGQTFHAGGGLQVLTGQGIDPESHAAVSDIAGGFLWSGAEGADDWLADGLVPDIYLYSIDYPSYDGRGVYVDGGVSGMPGEATAALFTEALLFSESLGSVCALEPTGTAQIRDADGDWWMIAFDTPQEGGMDPTLCDGCGTVSLAGQEVGTACADFSPWLDWELYPW